MVCRRRRSLSPLSQPSRRRNDWALPATPASITTRGRQYCGGADNLDMPSRSVLLTRTGDEADQQFQVDILEESPLHRVRAEGQVFEIVSDGHGLLRVGGERSTTAWAAMPM